MDHDLDKEPPYNISINTIATTLDSETSQEDKDDEDLGALVYSVTFSGA